VAYPNVMVMGYLKQTGQLTPELQAKLEEAIRLGYQRMLAFHVEGGFEWYGRPPAHTLLTAYALRMLCEMDRVMPMGRNVIDRAVSLLQRRQESEGSWSQAGFDRLTATACVAWSLAEAGCDISSATRYLALHWSEATDPHAMAVVALALGMAGSDRASLALSKLESMLGPAGWNGSGLLGCPGRAAHVETTALAALALMRGGRWAHVDSALTFLIQEKDPMGGWHTTTSTVAAIQAMLEASKAPRSPSPARVRLGVNGSTLSFKPVTSDTAQELPISPFLRPGENVIELEADSDAPMSYQIAARHYLPWESRPSGPISIDTRYDRHRLARGEELLAETTVVSRDGPTFMLMADLDVPAGFTIRVEDFEDLRSRRVIDKFTWSGRRVTVYLGEGQTFLLRYRLVPRFAIRTSSGGSRAYAYYAPERCGVAEPATLEVTPR
jgi:hypothetical protein